MSEGYYGWKNFETYNCNLWYGNMHDYAQEVFNDIVKSNQPCNLYMFNCKIDDFREKVKVLFVNHLADCIENMIESEKREIFGNKFIFLRDLVNSSIRSIDFREVASHYWESIDQSEIESIFANEAE